MRGRADDAGPDEPKEVIRWTNGMVMVFDHAGNQMTGLQGKYDDVRAAVMAVAGPATKFWYAKWNDWKEPRTREEW